MNDDQPKRQLLTEVPEYMKIGPAKSRDRMRTCPNCRASVTAVYEETNREFIFNCHCGSRWREQG
jgi:hypothetical protein